MKLIEMRVEEFLKETASNSPAPGGGSVSALAGALAAALAGMVANLFQGEKFPETEKMAETAANAAELRAELEACVQKDTDGFERYMQAIRLPKATEEEKAFRRAQMQSALKAAAEIPLGTAVAAAKIFPLAEKVLQLGNANAASDALVSAMLARTAVYGALLNVKINLSGIRDEPFVQEMTSRAEALRREAREQEERVLSLSPLGKDFIVEK